jgi:histidyl-tRNA synthetase
MEKPSLPKGTRDFCPAQMAKRQFIFDTIKKVFQKYGFQPLETPAMENLSTLTGKYGDEGDQLLFKVLDSGDFARPTRESIEQAKRFEEKLRLKFNSVFHATLSLSGGDEAKLLEIVERGFPTNVIMFDDATDKITEQLFLIYKTQIREALLKDLSKKENFNLNGEVFDVWVLAYQTSDNLFSNIFKTYLPDTYKILNTKELLRSISEKGLRYDLTVPFARYVVMNKGEITFPFKRYQIQPVWRADRPQKGRYREFYQCDADVVGTDSLICEAEIILMIKDVFKNLGIVDYSIKINHRGILSGLAALANATEKESSLFVAIDKLDKIGEEKVSEELASRGFDQTSLNIVFEILNFTGSTQQKIDFLTDKFSTIPVGQKGISDFKNVLNLLSNYGATEDHVDFDISLARGLSYYTGCIFEVKINNVGIGSVSGGGRYDNLTSMFDDKEKLSGVGFSFGVDRLYDAMMEIQTKENRNLFPAEALVASHVLVCHTNKENMLKGLAVLHQLRAAGIASEIYPDEAKAKKPLEKPLQYATKKSIPNAIVIDSAESLLIFKNVKTGEQEKLSLETIIERMKSVKTS